MNDFASPPSKITLEELRQDDGTYPDLKRTFTSVETCLMFVGIPFLTLYGIGVILMLIALTCHFFSRSYRVRNLTDGQVYLISRTEFNQYRELTKTK